jgi:murein DD-endopeptidase MepM/ murein hydrolase activator NlpD
MCGVAELLRAHALRAGLLPRAAMLALMAIGVAACSGDTSRFGDPSARNNPDATGSIPPAQGAPQGAPVGRVESHPLPAQSGQLPSPQTSAGIAGGGRGLASYNPAVTGASAPAPATVRPSAPVSPDVTGSVVAPRPAPTPAPPPPANWSWDGGTAITVAQGETIETIARRYGVPTLAIMQANNITGPGQIHPGQQLVIPRYAQTPVASAPAAATPAARAVATPIAHKPAPASPAGNPGVHVVAPGETLSKISRLYGKPVREIAKANNIQATAKLNVGDRLVIPGVRVSAAKPKLSPALAQAKSAPASESQGIAQPGPELQSASMVTPVVEPAGKDGVKSAEATGALPKFRWPANGRVIGPFGPTPNGQQNDGINIALPENTPVKAAEDGDVAYAGNELKGYGNLVLVRHPNGYVTAYAHAKELLVKRGDKVKRGQVIGRSGQTGNVNAPQLHFEIRKGATPLDPMKFLNGA